MGEHAQPPGTVCHSAALLSLPTQLRHHQRGGLQGVGTGDDWQLGMNWQIGMDEPWDGACSLLELGPLAGPGS